MVLNCYKRYTYVYIPRLSKLERYWNMAFLCLLPYSCRTDAIQLILPPSKCFHPMEVACLRGMSAWICTSKIWCATSARTRTWAIAFTFCKCLPWVLMLIYVYLMVTFGLLAYPCLFDVTCSQAVWGSQGAGDAGPTWQVFNTNDLPSPGRSGWKRVDSDDDSMIDDVQSACAMLPCSGEGENFDAKQIHQHSQQLLHFLRQLLDLKCS